MCPVLDHIEIKILPSRGVVLYLTGESGSSYTFLKFICIVHVKKKREELGLKYRKMYWLMGRRSALSIYDKLKMYKQILNPVWTYGTQQWGCTRQSNTDIIQRFQNKVLRNMVDAPWYIRNADLHRDLQMEMVTN
jgi:hypothetical protein